VVPGLLIGAAGVALFTQITPASGYAGLVLPAELLIGMGLGLSVMPLFATATREADPADAGATGAAADMAQQFGASAGTVVLNTIAATATASYVASHHGLTGTAAAAASHGYSVASVWAAAALVLAALIGGALITTRPRPHPVTDAVPGPHTSPPRTSHAAAARELKLSSRKMLATNRSRRARSARAARRCTQVPARRA
jgi:hypothetical protein